MEQRRQQSGRVTRSRSLRTFKTTQRFATATEQEVMGVVVMGIVVQPGKVAIEQLKLKENIKHEPDDHDIDILRDLRIHLDSFGNKQQYFIPFFTSI